METIFCKSLKKNFKETVFDTKIDTYVCDIYVQYVCSVGSNPKIEIVSQQGKENIFLFHFILVDLTIVNHLKVNKRKKANKKKIT